MSTGWCSVQDGRILLRLHDGLPGRMKARPFLAVVLAVTLLLLGLAAGAGWLLWQRSPLQLQRRALVVPSSARFVPRTAALGLFLLSDPQQPVDYARAQAPIRQRRQAAEAVARLRDGAFAAAGLDYPGELASWLGAETGLALVASQPGQPPDGWLLALHSRDGDGARRFLQRFWQTRSLAGTDLQVSSYRGMGVISGRGALLGSQPVPIATALIDDDLVLLASGRGVLEQALDVSQIGELNLAADPSFRQAVQRLGQGTLLLQLRPAGLESWLGLPAAGGAARRSTLPLQSGTVALRPSGRRLALEALLALTPESQDQTQFQQRSEPPEPEDPSASAEPALPAPPTQAAWSSRLDPALAAALTAGLRGSSDSLALLQDSAHWPESWASLLARLLQQPDAGPLPGVVMAADAGPLLWSQGPQGWLLATPADQPEPAALQPGLDELGLVTATLQRADGASQQVWTRLDAHEAAGRQRRSGPQLSVSLAGARELEADQAWWGQTLAALEQRRQGGAVPRDRLRALAALELPEAPLQWASGPESARARLRRWPVWRLLTSLAGQPLDGGVDGLALGLEPESGDGLHLRLDLGFG
ncbi:DUF3352 domain-containing protein [Cyanobium sp. NS01]|uniref:DUF3352 domain-containing protein n=1 Tax=Cyanobium sp. NS01 TaxID=261284 RepID=UPI0018629E10|nr:DUF3352 domain-containing protein [Cyanobium sp. NS01]QNI69530.1 hypothetical protein CyaNS01_00370 [Cyanobium sp. NS01]